MKRSSSIDRFHVPRLATDPRCWFLTGPTASGKSRLGVELAIQLEAEIISFDSMAIYRGMDIGTAKPTVEERRGVPHHLIDILDPADEYSLSPFLSDANRIADEVLAGGKRVLFVGGTPLYLKGLLRGIFQGPPADWDFRKRWEEAANKHGAAWLRERLAAVDPVSAARLHENDWRRMIRALEVHAKTGQAISDLQRQFETPIASSACQVFMLDWPREQLLERIDARVEAMFASGLVEETRRLLSRPAPFSRTARQALGYREVIQHLEGKIDLATTIALVKTRTRQFAKRQMTWFRSLAECRRIEMSADRTAGQVMAQILNGLEPS